MCTGADAAAYVDPRVKRTRRMLEQALDGLLQTKPFDRISVAEIAEAATLNRATFYGHFVDKFELLEGLVGSRFEDLLASRGVKYDGTCMGAVYAIALAVCDFLAGVPYCREQRQLEQQTEAAMVGIVRGMLLEGMRRNVPANGASPEMTAAAVAGAIYGAAKVWVAVPDRSDAEAAAGRIAAMVLPMMQGTAHADGPDPRASHAAVAEPAR